MPEPARDRLLPIADVKRPNQGWANAFHSRDGLPQSSAHSSQRSDRALRILDEFAVVKSASPTSMDPDGFTLTFDVANAAAGNVVTLALKGTQARADAFPLDGGAPLAIDAPGWQPELVMLTSFEFSGYNTIESHIGFILSASDGLSSQSSTVTDRDAVTPSRTRSIDLQNRVLHGVDAITGTAEYSADLVTTASGFTLQWLIDPGTRTDQQLSLAIRSTATCGTCDATEPDTFIVQGPPAVDTSNVATFTFESTEVLVSYECRLDGVGSFSSCPNPHSVTDLAPGDHALEVRARDAAGNVDPTPAEHVWTTTSTDAGPLPENPDAGMTPDSDAGEPLGSDGGVSSPEDAGTLQPSARNLTLGCACTGGSDGITSVLALLALLRFAGRRRPSAH